MSDLRDAENRVNVLHVIPSISLKHGGPSYAIRSVARAARQAGMKVVVATTDDDGNDARLNVPLGTPVERDGVTHFFFRRDFVQYKVSFALARWLNRNIREFDVVHIHALFSFSSTAAAMIAWRKKVPYVVRPLGVLNRWGLEHRRSLPKQVSLRLIELPILRRAAAIHFTTEQERREAADIGGDVATACSFVVPIPVQVKESGDGKEKFLSKYPAAAGKKLILFLSRIDRKKGIELLLSAFADVRRSEPNSFLVIAGDGDRRYLDKLRVQAGELKISADILWTWFLGQAEKANAFAAASVFVLPSYSENFGIAAAEALAMGKACVLTDQVAIAHEAKGANAAIVTRCDADELSDAIKKLCSDPVRRRALGIAARQFAVEYLSMRAIGEKLGREYARIVECHGTRRRQAASKSQNS